MKMPRPHALLLAGLSLAVPLVCRAQAREDNAPEPAFGERSLYLLHIPFLDFGPADPRPLDPGSAVWIEKSAYASTFTSTWHALTIHRGFGLAGQPFTQAEVDKIHRDFPQDEVSLIEGDVLRESLTGRVGVTPSLSASVELVYLSHDAVHGGSTIESFHRAFGFPQSGRDELPAGSFYVLLQRPNREITFDDRTPSSGLGDTTATLSWRPAGGGALRYGVDAAFKAPTGAAADFNGSGSWDGGVLGFVERPGQRWVLGAEGGLVVPGRWKSSTGLDVSPFARVMLQASRRFGERTRIGASATFEQSPFRRDGLGDVSRIGGEIGLGVSHDFPIHWSAALTVLENIPNFGDRADFGLVLRLGYR